jgi:hypothetical protein
MGSKFLSFARKGAHSSLATFADAQQCVAFGYGIAGTGSDLSLTLNEGESRHAGCDLHLDIDGPDLDTFERDRGDPLDHVHPHLCGRVAELFPLIKNV